MQQVSLSHLCGSTTFGLAVAIREEHEEQIQMPNVSTTRGIKSHPTSSITSLYLESFANFQVVAATPVQEEEEEI